MNIAIIVYVIGWVLEFEALFLSLPMFVGLYYKEYNSSLAYFIVAILCLTIGFILRRIPLKSDELYLREGFAAVAFSWLFLSVFGCFPFMITGEIPGFINALFETVSGFTTTGASILNDVEALSHASIFWRSFTHWVGGMGIFMLILTILPLAGAHGMNLMRAESPGPSVGKVLPKIKDTAIMTYAAYIGITVIGFITFLFTRMSVFEAATMIFGTVGTGGFGIYNDSVASFTPLQINVITFFMIISGINYNMYFCLMTRQFKQAFSFEEIRWYIAIIVTSTCVISYNIHHMYPTISESIRHAAFQVGSIITTSGFSTADFDKWPQFSKTILVILMFIGACAGSTGGGFKVSRLLILVKSIGKELQLIIHPNLSKRIHIDHHSLSNETLRSTNAYAAIYFILVFASVLLVGVDGFDFTTNFTAVAATLNNIGPGLELVGPTHSFDLYSNFAKCILIFDMLAGRLELFPVLILFVPGCWRKY
ncbi:MAG: TrkH family potassium uptake protein [Lachnospiraceae bacterium]|nr:TrkH family potassium uptake protein [Lachnospiraceae bacterium]